MVHGYQKGQMKLREEDEEAPKSKRTSSFGSESFLVEKSESSFISWKSSPRKNKLKQITS